MTLLIIKLLFLGSFFSCKQTLVLQNNTTQNIEEATKDSVAERMLIAQRNNGGWSQPNGNPFDYTKELSDSQKTAFLKDKAVLDATIDDDATTKEIRYLATAYKQTQNKAYKIALEKGLNYLFLAQNKAGGWGQFYPDSSGYHKHITYNDNAMMNVMWIMKYTAEKTNNFDLVEKSLQNNAAEALKNGIECILKTQYVQNGKLTAWCAQHDRNTLLPAKARAFELASLSGNESVGIVRFLMSLSNPNTDVKKAIHAACAWLESVKIQGIAVKEIADASQPSGKDRVVVEDPNSILWARFYDLTNNKPFFTGRNSIPKENLKDIENERRVGYAYYGTWPKNLLAKDYPEWQNKWGK